MVISADFEKQKQYFVKKISEESKKKVQQAVRNDD
jgi:hypothetical protein